ncbi:hypothetical protein C0J45_9595, partial [Silurus meridionalis]
MKHSFPFLSEITACLLKMRVSARRRACAVFIKMQPSMIALITRPTMFCMISTMTADTHSSVIMRPPNPIVTCTSMENRKAEENE